jgi:hypothetical protein
MEGAVEKVKSLVIKLLSTQDSDVWIAHNLIFQQNLLKLFKSSNNPIRKI